MNTDQEHFWAGSFGDDYTDRCRVDWWGRMPFWARLISDTRPHSVVELGCNVGWNLMAIRALGFGIDVRGVEINPKAASQAHEADLDVEVLPIVEAKRKADLVFTAGVLIHVGREQITDTMRHIAGLAYRYVVAIEYEANVEQEIPYRGHGDRLWRRPFGEMYQALGLGLVGSWPAGGFDRCTAWLLEKPRS